MNKKIKNTIKLVIGLGILIFLISKIGFKKALAVLPGTKIEFILLAILAYFIFLLLSAICVKLLSDQFKKIPFWTLFKYYLYSWTIGLLLPSKIGEFSIAYFFKKHKIKVGDGLAISLMDKMITALLFALFSFFAVFIFFTWDVAIKIFISLTALGLIFLTLLVLTLKGKLNRFLPKFVKIHIPDFSK